VVTLVARWSALTKSRTQRDPETGARTLVKAMDRTAAARVLGLPKKTLDDYLLHVRYGKLFGFDFGLRRRLRIGYLRQFVQETLRSEKRSRGVERLTSKMADEQLEDYDFIELLGGEPS